MRIVPAASVAALLLVFTLPVLATTQTGPFIVTVTTSPNPYAIEGTTSVNNSAGILAEATGNGDAALEGYAEGVDSAGLEGFASSTNGTASNGVYGYAANGYGVYGQAQNASDAGLLGLNLSTSSGMGVVGKAALMGVYGTTTTNGNYGVYGYDATTSQQGRGVAGQSTGGIGVIGYATSGRGVAGVANTGTGVYGYGTATTGVAGFTDDTVSASSTSSTTGNSSGVLGTDSTNSSMVAGNAGVTGTSTYGIGVNATSTAGYAIEGVSAHNTGIFGETDDDGSNGEVAGVIGMVGPEATAPPNVDMGVLGATRYGQGVYGSSTYGDGVFAASDTGTGAAVVSQTGHAIVAESSSTADAAVEISSYDGGDIIDAIGLPSPTSGTTNVMSLDGAGNMILLGGLTQHGAPKATVRDASGAERVAYSPRDTQATTEDFGRAQMVGGRAEVRLDPVFASTLADGNYLVFLTAGGRSNGLYVANRSLAGFEIRENEGASTLEIDYRIVGRPRAEGPEPRLALMAAHESVATQHLIRTGAEIARLAAAHRAADAKLRARMADDRLRHPRPVALLQRLTIPKPPAPPHIPDVRPGTYGPRLPHYGGSAI